MYLKVVASQAKALNAAFTGYLIGFYRSNTLINYVEISCESRKAGMTFLHAALRNHNSFREANRERRPRPNSVRFPRSCT